MGPENAAGSLISIVGSERYRDDDDTLSRYAASIGGTKVMPHCVVFPVNTQEVAAIIKKCAATASPLFVVSRGKNFGYGEAQGTQPGQVIIDLSHMNGIIEINEQLAYATIQPGVSQQQLYAYLQQKNSRLQLDVTGAGLDASIVGNILERGFGHTDYGDRFARVIRMTAVLMNGEIIRTGFGDHEGANAKNTYRYGIGPMLDGLLSQSNFGIITEMTFELMPKPEKTCMFIVSAKDESSFSNLVDAIRELKLAGVVNSAVHFANKARAIGEKENRMAGFWNMSGSISGPTDLVAAKKRIVRTALKKAYPKSSIWFIDDTLMKIAGFVHRLLNLSLYQPLKDAWDLQQGIPTDNPLRVLLNDDSLNSENLRTDDYQTCFLWINAVCASDGKSADRLYRLTADLFKEYGYAFPVTFTAVNARSLIMITNINYARNDEEIERAKAFSQKCHLVLLQNGFLPYRAGSGLFDEMPQPSAGVSAILNAIKSAADPSQALAPGKYGIGQ